MNGTVRVMMTRTALHALGTAVALYVSFGLWSSGHMWQRMVLYGGVWLGCAGAYFGVLYLWQTALDALDARIQAIVRDEQTAEDMRRYQRRLRFVLRWQRSKVDR
ncbi:MAG: hypothetical protein NVSMB19_02750 [Vulcanimicrobiaceae bacterium]